MKTLGGDRIFGEYREMKFHIGEVLYPRERERERESSFASKDVLSRNVEEVSQA